jgi:hypothetical protein
MVAESEDLELEEALAALRASRFVMGVRPICGERPGYFATLWHTGQGLAKDSRSEQLQTTKKRTLVGCARELLTLIEGKHGGYLATAELARSEAAAAAAAADIAGPSAPTAFAAMAAAQSVLPAALLAAAAVKRATEARAVLATTQSALETAVKAAEAAEADVLLLEEAAESAREAAALPRKRPRLDDTEPVGEELTWRSWTHGMWLQLEKKEVDRRAQPIDRTKMAVKLEDGTRSGWRYHWRRGVHGALIAWADGSLGAIIFMIAALATDFDLM